MRQLAERTLGVSCLAAGAFRTVAEVEPRGGLASAFVAFGWWAWIKTRSRLPLYPYVVVTEDELIVVEFVFGPRLRMRRIVGRWPRSEVRVLEASPEQRRAKVVLPPSRLPVELEGVFRTAAEREVVSRLHQLSTER